jgi:hypothetical protein
MLAAAGTASVDQTAARTQPHNECRAWVEENVRWPHPTQYRVAAECSYINPSEKARGTLDLTWPPVQGSTPDRLRIQLLF